MLSYTRQTVVNTLGRKTFDTFQRESYTNWYSSPKNIKCQPLFYVIADKTNLDVLVLPHSIDIITSISFSCNTYRQLQSKIFHSLDAENYLNKIFPAFTKSANLYIENNNIWIGRNFSRVVYVSFRIPYLFLSWSQKHMLTHAFEQKEQNKNKSKQTWWKCVSQKIEWLHALENEIKCSPASKLLLRHVEKLCLCFSIRIHQRKSCVC